MDGGFRNYEDLDTFLSQDVSYDTISTNVPSNVGPEYTLVASGG